jgi:hypothetical protein
LAIARIERAFETTDLLDARGCESRDPGEIEIREHRAIPLAFTQHGFPTQAGLRAFERDEFEEHRIIVNGDAPLLVVIGLQRRRRRPRAANRLVQLSLCPIRGTLRR